MVTLEQAKAHLRVTESDDDVLIQRLIDQATDECLAFCGVDALPSDAPESVDQGIMVMVQADYDADPAKRNDYRKVAETLWMPCRVEDLGV